LSNGAAVDKINVKPSKPLSAGAIIMLIFMLLFGIGFAVLVLNVLFENDALLVMKIIFPLFMVGWIGTVLFMLVYHVLNLKKKKGLPMFNIETEQGTHTENNENNPMERLRMLEKLKNDGLINDEEFRLKRKEILQERW